MGKISQSISKFLLHKVWGFKVEGEYAFHLPKKVVIAAPHTSWWDFPLGVLIRSGLQADINYVGKASLFKPPFGWFFKATGGVPVDRSKKNKFVDAIAEIYKKRARFNLCLAPEGTRKRVEKLKTGFYFIALKANVPIQMCAFDFENKIVRWSEPLHPTGNIDKDMSIVEDFFRGVKGKVPENSFI
ncbi:1-acyl-sn-glycerol-3-phosphate acyltransferase [Portibacter marinus]|uniref:1-acyl-sn-glycerol-3-phosphate acyltransferase n=1 Tax=Portibacter marinus TaxID=2898660 RepID=UPI001F16E875|nr:1-acyl-sn-glycerol-3-phosphate acyltransferase [Portibacter marinus]